jgi:hypothetical protein
MIMGSSKNYLGKPGWQGNNTGRGKESGYTKTPIMKPEGTHMSGENDSPRRGAKSQEHKSKTFSGPKQRKGGDSGY